jgi:hypothetical protein
MKFLATTILFSTALWAAPSLADDFSAGSEGTGEVPRSIEASNYVPRAGARAAMPRLEAGEESRAAPLTSEEDIIRALTAVGKSRNGDVLTVPASDAVKDAVRSDFKSDRG